MINVSNLTKDYGDLRAVNNISFSIKEGEITGLLGPNGAGKTTTLRMLTCYLKPSNGSILVNNIKTEDDPLAVRELIGYLPESAPIYGDMIVYDYLSYAAALRKIAEPEKKIREMAVLCGLREVMHKSVNELSKGYKQRVGLAHAMIHDPKILILDEPTSGLDPNQIIEIRKLIKEIGKRKTVILSTHILSEVEAACDRVIIINRGNIAADDYMANLQSAGRNRVTVKISGADFAALRSALESINGTERVSEESDDSLTCASVEVGAERDIRPDIFNMVKEKGWTLYEMKLERQSLENIFRQLTIGGEKHEV
ncbi:MAG: ATP-binding cassette domain-containing protein [Leptospirales bacterium]|nr:ATP-binding cassette domain-containing protein [Leptospirales bacterium]